MKRSRSGGFTLIELMVTVALVAVLLGLAVPSFARLVASNRLTTQTNEFTGMLHLARLEAIRRGQSIAIRADGGDINFDTGWKLFTDLDADGAAPGTVTATDGTVIRESGAFAGRTTIKRVTRSGTFGSFTYADATAADRMYLGFNSRGGNSAAGAAFFKVCDAGDSAIRGRVVQVSTVGRISLDSNNESC